jgi:hypothetical protein
VVDIVTDAVRAQDAVRRDHAQSTAARSAWELAREAYGRQLALAGEPF